MMTTNIQKQYVALEESKRRLFTDLQGFTHEKLNQNLGTDQWSMLQVVEHLLLVEASSLRYMQKKYQYAQNIPKAGLVNKLKFAAFRTLFKLPLKIKAPNVVAKLPETSELLDAQARWDMTRKELEAFLNQLPERDYELAIFKHPIAGRLNIDQTISFFAAHFAHHMKQIERIKASVLP